MFREAKVISGFKEDWTHLSRRTLLKINKYVETTSSPELLDAKRSWKGEIDSATFYSHHCTQNKGLNGPPDWPAGHPDAMLDAKLQYYSKGVTSFRTNKGNLANQKTATLNVE